jgi:hypothetical protein
MIMVSYCEICQHLFPASYGRRNSNPALKSFTAILGDTTPLLKHDLKYGSLHLIEADTSLTEMELRNCPHHGQKCNDGSHGIAQEGYFRGKAKDAIAIRKPYETALQRTPGDVVPLKSSVALLAHQKGNFMWFVEKGGYGSCQRDGTLNFVYDGVKELFEENGSYVA